MRLVLKQEQAQLFLDGVLSKQTSIISYRGLLSQLSLTCGALGCDPDVGSFLLFSMSGTAFLWVAFWGGLYGNSLSLLCARPSGEEPL